MASVNPQTLKTVGKTRSRVRRDGPAIMAAEVAENFIPERFRVAFQDHHPAIGTNTSRTSQYGCANAMLSSPRPFLREEHTFLLRVGRAPQPAVALRQPEGPIQPLQLHFWFQSPYLAFFQARVGDLQI